jgi:hypothetical protein
MRAVGHLSQKLAQPPLAQRLEKSHPDGQSFLRALQGRPSLEFRRRVEQILKKLPSQRLQMVRGITVLERLGTADARQLLERLAKGPREARLTQEAKAALERLARQQTARR